MINITKTGVGLLAVVLATAGCDGRTGPDLSKSFDIAPTASATGEVPPTRVTVTGGALVVSGYFETGCSGERVRGMAVRQGTSGMRIWIWAIREGGTCAFRPDPYTYEGRVHGLEPGEYRVIVEHRRDARTPDGVVLDTVGVTIP